MIKTIIIEDEPKAAVLLNEMLKEIEPQIMVIEKCPDLPTAVRSIKKNQPDLVFLDVELPVYNGLQLLEFLNPEEISFKIIFTTASNDHALRAFDMSAVDYVLKPIQFEKLKMAVEKFLFNRNKNPEYPYTALKDNFFKTGTPKIVLAVSSWFEIIKLDDILFIGAEGSYAKFYLHDGTTLIVSHNLKYFEDMLHDAEHFVRIHRSSLVNVHFAKRITRTDGAFLVMENGTQLPISNEKIEVLLNFFNFQKKG
jgi:two-component system LytT family response regulator